MQERLLNLLRQLKNQQIRICSCFENVYSSTESAKFRALHAYVLMCQRVLGAYVLTCQRVLRAYVLTCQRALRGYVLTCQRVLGACVLVYYNFK